MRLKLLFLLPLCLAVKAHAHDPGVLGHANPYAAWTFDPWVAVPMLVSAVLYAVGVRRLWQRAGSGRGLGWRQVSAFIAGWGWLVVALNSPLDTLGVYSFSAHMLQHEVLMLAAAPLLVVSRPLAAWLWALPPQWRRRSGNLVRQSWFAASWRAITSPLSAWIIHAVVLWAWHAPGLFNAALTNETAHTLQHISFLASALLFWWTILGRDARVAPGVPILSLLTTLMHTGLLGALLTFAPRVWYTPYVTRVPMLGLDPLVDQQLGGLIMWVPAGAVYIVAALMLGLRWLKPDPIRAAPGDAALAKD